LNLEAASSDVSDNTLALFDKGVAALKEARMADQSLKDKQAKASPSSSDTWSSDASSTGASKGSSAGSNTGNTSSNKGSTTSTSKTNNASKTNKPSSNANTSKTTTRTDQRADTKDTIGVTAQDDLREHRALGELYQFGNNLGMTPLGAEA